MTQTRDPGSPSASTSTTTTGEGVRTRDDRTFYRTALAVVAPLPMLAMGLTYFLIDVPSEGPLQDMVDAVARQQSVLQFLFWVGPLWFAFLIPAVIAVAAVARRTSPRLTATGIVLTVPGFGMGFSGPNDVREAYLAHTEGLDVGTLDKLNKAEWAMPSVGIGSLFFIVGIVIGLLLLGIALARSGAVPVWFGVALAAGGFTHPFLSVLGHQVVGVGLGVAAVGFAGASLALLRTSNDEFAPAPVGSSLSAR